MEDIDAIMTLYILSSYLTENFYCKHNNNSPDHKEHINRFCVQIGEL